MNIIGSRIAPVWHIFIKETARKLITFLVISNLLETLLDNINPLLAFPHKVRSLGDRFVQASVKLFIVGKHIQ